MASFGSFDLEVPVTFHLLRRARVVRLIVGRFTTHSRPGQDVAELSLTFTPRRSFLIAVRAFQFARRFGLRTEIGEPAGRQ